jgi:N-acetylneuraminic acid mutarotase
MTLLAFFSLTASAFAAEPAPTKSPEFPAMPKGVSSFGAIECDGYLYIYGGHSGKTHNYDNKLVLGTFHRLKLDGGAKWEELPGGPIAQGLNLAAHGGKVYRVGGMQPKNPPGEGADNHSLADCARFDPKAGKWEDLPALPAGRSSHDVVAVGDKLLVVGGWQLKGKDTTPAWHDTALILDLTSAKPEWKSIPQPFKRRALSVASHGGRLYVLGGLVGGGMNVDRRVDVYDPASGAWSRGPDLPAGGRAEGFGTSAFDVAGRLYFSGFSGRIFRLDDSGANWEAVGAWALPRLTHRLLPGPGDSILAVGGASKSQSQTAEIEIVHVGAPVRATTASAGE